MWEIIHNGMSMSIKTIQVTMDDTLLSEVDQTVQEMNLSRSAFIRQVLAEALRRYRIRKLEKQDAEGYARIPSRLDEVEIWLEEQVWGNEWNAGK